MRRTLLASTLLLALVGAGCQKATDDKGKTGSGTATAAASGTGAATGTGTGTGAPAVEARDLDSKDILAREPITQEAHVKHVLLAWKELAPAFRGQIDPRAKDRSNADAAALAEQVAQTLRSDPKAIDDQIKQHSEDPGSLSGDPYVVTPDARYVPEFKNLAMRLNLDEVGIVKTQFGYHVMIRVTPPPPPPPDPLESADILARPAQTDPRQVQHILIGWKDAPMAKKRPPDPRAAARTKEDADKLAVELLAKVRGGADMAKLMKEHSEDPGSKDTGRAYDVTPAAGLVPPFKNLSMRLEVGEAGLVKTDFGWHVIKRIPPPPPDPLESKDILARKVVAEKGKVKHILLGWKEVNAGDPRGKERDRKALEKLVKATVARLKKGEKIEPLMKELSEDPGSAQSGDSYPYDPNAGLVEPFKQLSMRLELNEVGVVKTDFGIHIIQRVE